MNVDVLKSLTGPAHLFTRAEILARPSPVPTGPGIYAWFFDEVPDRRIRTDSCVKCDRAALLYVGIAPKRPPASGAPGSRQTLRGRIRQHCAGNASGSTLRLTLGCLLSDRLGIQLRRIGRTERLWFTDKGEAAISEWMSKHARIAWAETPEPWVSEDYAVATLDLPLNLRGNERHPFHPSLVAARAEARARARELPILV